jgi:hypothetical protein
MASDKICPICKNKNVEAALVCSSCGFPLNGTPTNIVNITEYVGRQPAVPADEVAAIDSTLIPEGGIGIYIAGALKPYYVPIYRELIIGRETDATLEAVLDLSELDGFNLGVSRRHAAIRRADSGFEVVDLSSRNGTWLNDHHLIPNKPYPFASGSHIRLGRMRLYVVYHVEGKDAQK